MLQGQCVVNCLKLCCTLLKCFLWHWANKCRFTKPINDISLDLDTPNKVPNFFEALSANVTKWCEIGTHQEVVFIYWIQKVLVSFTSEPDCFNLPNHKLTYSQSVFVKQEIENLLQVGAIQPCDTTPPCVSALECPPKKVENGVLSHISDYWTSTFGARSLKTGNFFQGALLPLACCTFRISNQLTRILQNSQARLCNISELRVCE